MSLLSESSSPRIASPFSSTFPWRIFSRFVIGQILFVIVLLAAVGLSARSVFRESFVKQATDQARAVLLSLGPDVTPASQSDSQVSGWCASHSGGVFTFSLIRIENAGVTACSTIPFERARTELKDSEIARRKGFGAVLMRDPLSDLPILLASLALDSQGWIIRTAMPLPELASALIFFDRSLVGVLFILGLAFAGFSAWTGRRLVIPLGRLLQKAKRVGEREDAENAVGVRDIWERGRISHEGEWSDLETSLDRIQSNLQNKTETLAREREELATLMSALSEAIVAVDRDGNPLFYNSRFALSFVGRSHSALPPSLGEIFRAPEILEAFNRALESGQNETVEARLHLLQAGGVSESLPRFFSISVAPLRRTDEIYGAVGIFHDITELKRAEQIRIDFVANVSHELRTPLTSIKGYTDTLRQDLREGRVDSAEKFFEIIGRNVERLMSLISDLLDLSSLESQESQASQGLASVATKVPVSTQELTRRVLGQIEGVRAKKNHEIETRFGAAYVDGQPERIEQVLTNLVENAIKYLPAGGKIQVLWESLPKCVLLRVADNGPGIPPEHQSRLFERFYRIDKARSRELGGTGLGLAIVKHIMQVHGGTVYVTSEPGKGAEFVCQFPHSV